VDLTSGLDVEQVHLAVRSGHFRGVGHRFS
jgi:hypothetical protein